MIKETINQVSSQMFSKQVEFVDSPVTGKKAMRSEEMLSATVVVDGYVFNADEKAMDRIDRIVDLANWKYNQATASGVPAATAYNAVYIGNTLPWKTLDDQLITVTVEQLCKAQELAINQMGNIWVSYG